MKDTHCEEVPEIIDQHKVLLDEADAVLELATGMGCDAKAVRSALDKFEAHLKSHMEYENKVFYGKLLKDMWDDGENTTSVEKFIADMKRIADVVFAFLEQYRDEESISKGRDTFYRDFGRIVGILILRIESEETSKYFTDCEHTVDYQHAK